MLLWLILLLLVLLLLLLALGAFTLVFGLLALHFQAMLLGFLDAALTFGGVGGARRCARGFRSLRALEWGLDPKATSLASVPPPYNLGPDMNYHPCAPK